MGHKRDRALDRDPEATRVVTRHE